MVVLPQANGLKVSRPLFLICAAIAVFWACGRPAEEVIVYASQDQVYAEPIFNEFTAQTGIKVRALYDSEAVKTVGLANRLLAERQNPRCDVFWSNEELRTRQLAAKGVFAETNGWAAFGYRSRRIVINTNKVALAQAPRSMRELTNGVWRGKAAIAQPFFGTTATHFLALRQHWGEQQWLRWCQALKANKPFLVNGNSVVVNMVGRGEAAVGLTDSDDIAAGQLDGMPIIALPITDETSLIPNTVAVISGGPNPSAARKLFAFLQQPQVVTRLVDARALEGLAPGQEGATLRPNWESIPRELERATAQLEEIFLR